jgi:amino acid transporter
MSGEKPLLFVRRASGLTRAIPYWTAIYFGIATSAFMPWHYYLMTIMPNWYPGTNLPVVYFLGGLIVVFECLAMALVYVACPRSGSIYVPLSRATSPMLGLLEAWRSIITNPTQRGITAFLAAGQLASLVVITGQLSKDAGLMAAGQALASNVWLLVGIGFIMQLVGVAIDILGPRIMARWYAFWGSGVVFGILLVNVLYAMTPNTALPAKWDNVFGAGAYNEVVGLAKANGFQAVPWSWGGIAGSLTVPVVNTWPYVIAPVVGEVEKPRQSIPLSMVGSAVFVMVINTLSAYNFTNTYGDFSKMYNMLVSDPKLSAQFKINTAMPTDLSAYAAVLSGSPFLAGLTSFSPQWSNFCDMVGNCYYTSRPLFAIAMDRMGPELLAKVHPRFHSPYMGSMFWFLWSLITLFLAGWDPGTVAAVVFGITFVYGVARMMNHWSEVELPFSRPEIYKTGIKLEIGGWPVMSIIGAFMTGMFFYLLATLGANPVSSGLLIGIVYGWGAFSYIYYGKKNQAKGIVPAQIFGQLPPE